MELIYKEYTLSEELLAVPPNKKIVKWKNIVKFQIKKQIKYKNF